MSRRGRYRKLSADFVPEPWNNDHESSSISIFKNVFEGNISENSGIAAAANVPPDGPIIVSVASPISEPGAAAEVLVGEVPRPGISAVSEPEVAEEVQSEHAAVEHDNLLLSHDEDEVRNDESAVHGDDEPLSDEEDEVWNNEPLSDDDERLSVLEENYMSDVGEFNEDDGEGDVDVTDEEDINDLVLEENGWEICSNTMSNVADDDQLTEDGDNPMEEENEIFHDAEENPFDGGGRSVRGGPHGDAEENTFDQEDDQAVHNDDIGGIRPDPYGDPDDEDPEINPGEFVETDDYDTILKFLSKEWLKTELNHRVSKTAANAFWNLGKE